MSNARGIDISVWQVTTPSLKGKDFAIARASYALTKDRRYDMHMANIKAAGVVSGAYHFNEDSIDPRSQARFFIKTAGDVDLYAIDVEGTMAFNLEQTKAFIDECQKLGKKCGLYHSASGYMEAGQDWDWIAKWSDTPPSHRWDFWQYGSDHDYNATIDGNVYHGTVAQLRAWVGNTSGEPVNSFQTPKVPTQGDLAKGVVLYPSTPLDPNDPKRIILNPGRTMPLVGTVASGVRAVTYVDDQGINTGWSYFINSADMTNVRPIPMTGDDGYTKATQDAAVAAQKQSDQAAIDAANAAAAQAKADLAGAAAHERERIATVRGQAEADLIRTT